MAPPRAPAPPGPGQPAVQKPGHGQAAAASARPAAAAAGNGRSGGFPLARTGASLALGVLAVLATTTGTYVLRLRRRQV